MQVIFTSLMLTLRALRNWKLHAVGCVSCNMVHGAPTAIPVGQRLSNQSMETR
jgi:hypothetical protein